MRSTPLIVRSKEEMPNSFWRPPFQFKLLPMQTRWEVTRRHPVYLAAWNSIDASKLTNEDGEPLFSQEVLDFSRFLCLGAIGINSDLALSPQTEFSELGELNPAWKSGVVLPTSFGGLATLLIAWLPKDTLAYLGMKFVEAGLDDEIAKQGQEPISRQLMSIRDIAKSEHEGLDKLTPRPFVSITPGASGRQVEREIKELLNQWKEQGDLDQSRERNIKHKEYLAIWDLREGWVSGEYRTSQGKTLAEIAKERGVPLTTVHSQYKSAFKLITGHSYRYDTYLELFGWSRYQGLFGPEPNMKWRRLVASSPAPVPESRLGVPLDAIKTEKPEDISIAVSKVISEFEGLIKQGRSDEEAAKELGIKSLSELYRLIELDSLSA